MKGSKIRTLSGAMKAVAILTARCAEYDEALGREADRREVLHDNIQRLTSLINSPVPMRLRCPQCGELHIDEGEFATKPHHTHACQFCGEVWRPATIPTVGVQFLPGFKNEPQPNVQEVAKKIVSGEISVNAGRAIFGLPELPGGNG